MLFQLVDYFKAALYCQQKQVWCKAEICIVNEYRYKL